MIFDGLARMKAVVLEILHAARKDMQDHVFLLALEYDKDAETIASIVAATTLVSLVTISIVVSQLGALV